MGARHSPGLDERTPNIREATPDVSQDCCVHPLERHRPDRDLHPLGGTAYANNEWTGANIVDGSLTTFDYKNDDIRSADVRDGTLKAPDLAADAIPSDDECASFFFCFSSTKIADRAVGASEISPGAVGTSEAAPNSLTGSDVHDNSLTGSDINESTLSPFGLPGPVSFTFADDDTGQICNGYCTEGSLKFTRPAPIC